MNRIIKSFFALSIFSVAIFSITSCKETCPAINFTDQTISSDTVSVPLDTSLNSQTKNVLLEDFTGVRCVNCPDGHLIAASILDAYAPGRVVVVGIHSGDLYTDPYAYGTHDFRTTEGDDIEAMVGPLQFKPCGDINRKLFTGQTERLLSRTVWAGKVAAEIPDDVPKVQMKFEHTYDNATRKLTLGIILQYAEALNKNLNLSVMLTEGGIIEPQLDQPGVDSFYVHHHVLRDMITPSMGMPVQGVKTPGHATKYLMPDFDVPASWNADSVKIVSFITDADSLNVMQVIEKPLK